MSGKTVVDPKGVSEALFVYFDFASELAPTETILAQTVTAAVYSGTDASPSDIIDGAASHTGTEVKQSITGGVVGVTYLLTCSISTDAGQILTMLAYLTVEDD